MSVGTMTQCGSYISFFNLFCKKLTQGNCSFISYKATKIKKYLDKYIFAQIKIGTKRNYIQHFYGGNFYISRTSILSSISMVSFIGSMHYFLFFIFNRNIQQSSLLYCLLTREINSEMVLYFYQDSGTLSRTQKKGKFLLCIPSLYVTIKIFHPLLFLLINKICITSPWQLLLEYPLEDTIQFIQNIISTIPSS